MKRVNFTEGMELVVGDMNKMVTLAEQNLQDQILKQLFQNQSDLVFNNSFKVLRNSNTSVDVSAGLGWLFQTQLDPAEAENRMVYLAADASFTITPDATNPRIDLVCIEPSTLDADTENRRTKASDFGAILNENRVVTKQYGANVQIVTGTPAASPVAPAVPAGFVKIAEVYVTAVTGIVDQTAITDTRNTLSKLFEDFKPSVDGSELGNPAPGKVRLWYKTDGQLYLRNSSGVDTVVPVSIDATAVISGVLDEARIPNLDMAKITTGTLAGTRVDQATTTVRGTVQLNSTLTSTSTTLAATASTVKTLNESKAGVYTGSNVNLLDYPFGTIIDVIDFDSIIPERGRNQTISPRLDDASVATFTTFDDTPLSGTWRRRGRIRNSDGDYIAQRTSL